MLMIIHGYPYLITFGSLPSACQFLRCLVRIITKLASLYASTLLWEPGHNGLFGHCSDADLG
jgi:hypothetical protein